MKQCMKQAVLLHLSVLRPACLIQYHHESGWSSSRNSDPSLGTNHRHRHYARATSQNQRRPQPDGRPRRPLASSGLTVQHKGYSLLGPEIWVEDRGVIVEDSEIIASPRVEVDYAGEDALLPWRFRVRNSKWTSPPA